MTTMLPRTTNPNGDLKVDGQDVHKWLMDLGWDADTLRGKYPTKSYDPKAQEQFKLIVRDYARMEAEKDQRQYGSLLDSLSRLEAGRRVEPRWGEMMKLLSGALELQAEATSDYFELERINEEFRFTYKRPIMPTNHFMKTEVLLAERLMRIRSLDWYDKSIATLRSERGVVVHRDEAAATQ